MRRLISALLVIGLGSAMLSGCAAPQTPEAAVSVEVYQLRSDYAPRQLQVSVTNRTSHDIRVVSATFSSDYFEGSVDSASAPSAVFAHATTDFTVVLPAARCDSTAANPAVLVKWNSSDGTDGRYRGTPAEPFGSLGRVHAQDCSRVEFERVATITPAAALRYTDDDGKPIALLDLSIRPTGAPGSVTLKSVQDTTLLTQREGQLRPFDLTFTAASPPVTITLDFTPSRCIEHVVAEDKVGTLIPIHAETADYPDATFSVAVSSEVKFQIYDWVGRYCGWGSSR